MLIRFISGQKKGALLHAKSLNTDKAWEVYDYLVDFYFRAKEGEKIPVVKENKTGDNRKTGYKRAFRYCSISHICSRESSY